MKDKYQKDGKSILKETGEAIREIIKELKLIINND